MFKQRQQQVLGGDVLVAERRQFVVAVHQHITRGRRQLRRCGIAANARQPFERGLGRRPEVGRRRPSPLERGNRDAFAVGQ